ncbi:MAG: Jag N-terminal domain-containing protein [Candidatus Omnitrophota bacterium]
MESIEIEGKNPESAIRKALKILNVARKDVEIKILSEEKRGLFGMEGGKPSRVRVTVIKKK